MTRSRRAPPAPPASERWITGRELQMPLLTRISLIHSQGAARITWHQHPQFELLFVMEGETAYEFADKRRVEVPGGHFLVVPPRTKHRGLYDVRRPARLCGLLFDPRPRPATTHANFQRRELRWLTEQFSAASCEPRPMHAELRRLVTGMESLALQDPPRSLAATAALRLKVAATLLEAAEQLIAARPLPPTRAVQAAIAFMDEHFAEPLSMQELAAVAGYSRARFFHIFKSACGLTPNDYLQRLRLKKAQAELHDTRKPVTEIALACGFSNSQYFSNVFRKYLGQTPSAWRLSVRV